MYQRSCDLGLGVPFNIASYALLTHMIAHITGTEAHEFILQMGDAHVYKDHVEPLKEQLGREPRQFPILKFARGKEELEAEGGIDGFRIEDFVVEGYKPMGKIEMKMSVSHNHFHITSLAAGCWQGKVQVMESGQREQVPLSVY